MSFFRDVIGFFQDMHDINKELAQDVRKELKSFKNDMKDLTKEYYPKTGEAIEKIDRLALTIGNAKRSLPIPTSDNPIPIPNFPKLPIFNKGQSEKFQLADHIFVKRTLYEHHALYFRDNKIIHYSNGYIRVDDLEAMDDQFNISNIRVKNSLCLYDADQIIRRALSRKGESNYNLALNNCEHFVTWCRSGGEYSDTI